jgi:hypothetical protein
VKLVVKKEVVKWVVVVETQWEKSQRRPNQVKKINLTYKRSEHRKR